MRTVLVAALLLAVVTVRVGRAEDRLRIFCLSKNVGYEHSVVKLRDGRPSVADEALTRMAGQIGADIDCTKDAGLVTKENLAKYDVTIFFTNGDLTTASRAGEPNMGPNGVADLLDWIRGGGGFIGFHNTTGSFRSPARKCPLPADEIKARSTDTTLSPGEPPTPFIEMLGAQFLVHGKPFDAVIKVVDPSHPTMAHVPMRWQTREEWYLFRHFNRPSLHVLAVMDPGPERAKQKMYNIPDIPVIWCRQYGAGRVYYNALGHFEERWEADTVFHESIKDAIRWVAASDTKPNWDAVVRDRTE